MTKHPTMDGNYNYHKSKHRHSHIKNTNGSMSYSSSDDEEDFHSDDNLRPYEEVKVAHNHKKLNGLGLTPDIISAVDKKGRHDNPKDPQLYHYKSGSDGDLDSDQERSAKHASLNVNHQGSQCSISSNELDHEPTRQNGNVSRLSMSDSEQENVSHRHSHAFHQPHVHQPCMAHHIPYPALHHAATAPAFPYLPPPPPPPIEDIPGRTPIQKQRSLGQGSNRGTYSDAETCVCHRHYGDSYSAHYHRGHYSDMDTSSRLRHCPYSEGEVSDFEPHYLEQTPSGNVYIPDGQPRFPRTVPRSGSCTQEKPCSQSRTSNTVPNHCQNGHDLDRHAFTHPGFSCQQQHLMGGYPPPVTDDYYYSKFNCTGKHMKKLQRGCTWRCTALVLVAICVVLLACTLYFAAAMVFKEKDPVSAGALNSSSHLGSTVGPTYFLVGDPNVKHQIPPKSFWMLKFNQDKDKRVKFNFSIPSSAILGVYGRRGIAPSIVQYDFFEVLDGSTIPMRKTRSTDRIKRSYYGKDTGFVQYLMEGKWYLNIYNDRNFPQYISFKTAEDNSLVSECPSDCYGHGDCVDGNCRCFPGFIGWDCKERDCLVVCNGNGQYIGGVCHCIQGWKGQECNVPENECALPDCNGNGYCHEGECHCDTGFQGPHCGIVDCLLPNCSGNGVCHLGQCVCFKGFKGHDCRLPDKLNVTNLCARDCSERGKYDAELGKCICDRFFTGKNCQTEVCRLTCYRGTCRNQKCICDAGWGGALCDQLSCDPRCDDFKGKCENGTCVCRKGWNGKHCTIDGCPNGCSKHGECRHFSDGWKCTCHTGWTGKGCDVAMEMVCDDMEDNDRDGLKDCQDPDCCFTASCVEDAFCQMSPDPVDILLRKQPPSPTASFYDRMKFLIEENSVQIGTSRNAFNESQVSVIRGAVLTKDGTPLLGVRVTVTRQPLYGYTLTRREGQFDILVNGGGSVTLEFTRLPFITKKISVLVPWNQIVTMETVVMHLKNQLGEAFEPDPKLCGVMHDHYKLKPVVLSTWQHTQLGACPERSTLIPESQVLQESIEIPGTHVHLVYHSSDAIGYKSVILIQMTPDTIPSNLALVHLKVYVEGNHVEKTFEADPELKYTHSWDRKNAYNQKVYGIVPARVHVGYKYTGCDYVFWEVRSTTMSGFDMTSSGIGGWNLDIHHTYNFQEGILHKGDGTNIYLKEKPQELVNILGNGQQRKPDCDMCNGRALDNSLLLPIAMASGRDGSLYVWDHNFIRKVTPGRDDIASILETSSISTSHKPYMTVSPVDGRLYISDYMKYRIIKIATMGPVKDLKSNFEVVAGTGEECPPMALDKCGDGKLAKDARLVRPKGIAISKDGIIYVADNLNIRKITPDGKIHTLIDSQAQSMAWEPMDCGTSQPADKVRLQWPTDLTIDPLDDTLHILDKNVIMKMTKDRKLITIAGRPINCPINTREFLPTGVLPDNEQASGVATDVTLVNPQSLAFGNQGELYVVESDTHHINRVRVVTSDGLIHHFAGVKSKCDCQQIMCKCYKEEETLAAQALFNELTSITVTPDGIVHIGDAGNLRVFSIMSKLPPQSNAGEYVVVSPETEEIYVFNHYGQHKHTVNIMTDQYMYNFTYNVNSFYGKLENILDDAGNKVEIKRNYAMHAKTIISPDNSRCEIIMDNMNQLQKFLSPDNSTAVFKYAETSELLISKFMSNGKTYIYSYNQMGRLREIQQPTGEVTELKTDVNTTGSIVHVTTDGTDIVAMATYGSVQSAMHGPAETKVTYLPDGTIVVVFPSNMSISVESGEHPILENQHRMHFKRKIIMPGKLVHKLEWRFYKRTSKGPSRPRKIERVGNRMRVGASFSRHANMHDTHGAADYKGKALLINGENLLTVQYDRETHTEKIMKKDLQEIITIQYDDSGLPTSFSPANGHHALNITYRQDGHISHWQYGEIREQRIYNDAGLLQERLSSSGAPYTFRYRYGRRPTDILMPSGLQYYLEYDNQGNLKFLRTPGLGKHYFNQITSIGVQRYLYHIPELENPYIEEYDANGKLLQVLFPSEQRKVVYKYNMYAQPEHVYFDGTDIHFVYDDNISRLKTAEIKWNSYNAMEHFEYAGTLFSQYGIDFAMERSLSAVSTYAYDNNFRLTEIRTRFGKNFTTTCNMAYDTDTGRLKSLKSFKFDWPLVDSERISDSHMTITSEYDNYNRLQAMKYKFGEKEALEFSVGYDTMNRIHHWSMRLQEGMSSDYQYVYDINGNVVDILLDGQSTWRYRYDNNGNINKISERETYRILEYDVGDRLKKSGPYQYKYDKDGFLIQRHNQQITFNSNGQFIGISQRSTFRRMYIYDTQGRLIMEDNNFGGILQFFYMNIEKPLLITHSYNHTTSELSQYLYHPNGKLIGMERNNIFYYVATDPMGSPLVIFNKDGGIVKKMSYDPLGKLESDSSPGFQFVFGFQGGIYSPVTELVMLNSRVYDTATGHWISPGYSQVLKNLRDIPENPLLTNNYRFMDLINVHVQRKNLPITSITNWLLMLGYDVRSLAPDISYSGEIRPKQKQNQHVLLPMSSAFECTFLRDMDSLITMTNVPKSKVSPLQESGDLEPAPLPFIFGNGVMLSYHDGKAVVTLSDDTPMWANRLALVLVNSSQIVNLRFNIKGKDTHYLIKPDHAQADIDLNTLDIKSDVVLFDNNINVTVHRNKHIDFRQNPNPETDIRLRGKHSVINIRYGTTIDKERKRLLKHAKERAVTHAWAREKWILQNNLKSKHQWTEEEKQSILNFGFARGYEGHFIRRSEEFPDLSDDCNNIRFVKSNR
ncbi:teneurin-m-like isoform X2 [Mytilus trossulus]|uniref:teneurin-m-like isoform X2 n=1 Tax=Mytilus trossulus TaxID=6551 RepID=UPI003003BED8